MSNNEEDSSDNATEDESYTTSDNVRVRFLGSALSSVIILAWFGLMYAVAFGYASLGGIGASAFTTTVMIVLAATGWVFGVDLVRQWLGTRGK